jgi:hypothetical protein
MAEVGGQWDRRLTRLADALGEPAPTSTSRSQA